MTVVSHRRGPFRFIRINRVAGGWQCAVLYWDRTLDRGFAVSPVYETTQAANDAAGLMRARTGLPIDATAIDQYLAAQRARFNRDFDQARTP